jgi:chromosome segregation ATPase
MSEFMNAAPSKTAMTFKITSGVLGVVALLGSGLYVNALSSSEAQESALQEQISRLQAERDEVTAERQRLSEEHEQLRRSAGELQAVQRQLASVQEQVKSLEQARAQLTGSMAEAQAQPTGDPSASGDEPRSQTGTTRSVSTPAAQVRAAQEALTQLGYGQLEVDGRIGPNTRRAIEAFEQAQRLAVTGELGARTVQALESTSGVSIQ